MPLPAVMHSYKKTEQHELDTVNETFCNSYVDERVQRKNAQFDEVAKCDSVLTCSNQMITKLEKQLTIPEAYLDKKGEQKMTCDETIHLPECDLMSVKSAGSLHSRDENELNPTIEVYDQLLTGNVQTHVKRFTKKDSVKSDLFNID